MTRFSVYADPSGQGYLMDIQADAMSHFNTRVVIPLLPLEAAPAPARILNPLFDIDGRQHVMATQYLAAVPAKLLKNAIFHADGRREEIVAAVDLLLQGF